MIRVMKLETGIRNILPSKGNLLHKTICTIRVLFSQIYCYSKSTIRIYTKDIFNLCKLLYSSRIFFTFIFLLSLYSIMNFSLVFFFSRISFFYLHNYKTYIIIPTGSAKQRINVFFLKDRKRFSEWNFNRVVLSTQKPCECITRAQLALS